MDQRRQMLSALVAVTLFVVWMQVAPLLFPGMFPAPKGQVKPPRPVPNAIAQADDEKEKPAEPASKEPAADASQTADTIEVAEFPSQTVTLGDKGFDGGFLIKAELDSKGAAIKGVWLTDPRYTTTDRKAQLQLVGNEFTRNVGSGPVPEMMDTSVPAIDKLLEAKGLSLVNVNWELLSKAADGTTVTFRYPSPAGDLEVLKTFSVHQVDTKKRDTDIAGYLMDITVEIRNLTDKKMTASYTMQGPVGIPLEEPENTRVHREIKLGTLENSRNPEKVTATNVLANALVKQFDKAKEQGGRLKDWRAPVRYVGVDDQFFASLIIPKGDQLAGMDQQGNPASLIAVAEPQLLYLDRKKPEFSNLSVLLHSPELTIPANGKVVNNYESFFGPKRPALMRELSAESIIQLGWFAPVAKVMLVTLGFFHSSLHLPYALAIILLTVMVRLAMMPISRKQAIEGEKMKILAPKMKELQERYKSQPEEFARAYREFQKKHNYHPMMGCLPALIQLPIFLGLYNSLYHAVDLRLAKFLWIDNLAAPDRLFHLPFTIPYLGTDFNLLPVITVILFVAQQKLFTPPPTSEEQAMQYKMMNFMMIFIGFAFYLVPAGLCLYFIASSLWGICERLWLKKSLITHQQAIAEAESEERGSSGTVIVVNNKKGAVSEPEVVKNPTWWEKLRSAADQAKNATEGQQSQRKFTKDKGNKGSKPRR